MNSKQRAFLKSQAQNLDSTLHVGKNGVTPELVNSITQALDARELLKISVLNNCEIDIEEVCTMISERTKSVPVQIIGKKIILYKQPKKNAKIILPK
ncbi:MAG: RNA-binding protein [Epulopiscium sp. Nuni2H_MBin003]|nr:MAG: RNA-binding protein [Epulopiscium sp. Nuni2H_MBin003]